MSSPRQQRLVLGVVGLALMMVVAAVSGLNVALPDLARDTGASQTELQWIVDAYTVVFAGLLIPAGALGDRIGRKRVLLAGVAIFGATSTLAMFVSDPGSLIALRAIMGVGAALVMPATLSIITASFPEEDKASAIGVWVGIAGGGAVIGLLGSGALLEFFSWSSFFALNVALAVLALVGTIAVIPSSRDAEAPALDAFGAVLSLLTVTAGVFGVIEGPARGWSDPLTVGALITSAVAGFAFVRWELRADAPMLDPRLFKMRGFSTGALSLTVQFFAVYGFFFIALQYLQFVAGLSPFQASLALLPLPAVLIPLARRTPRLAERVGINRTGSVGLALMAVGLVVLTQLEVDLNYLVFASGLVVFAAGVAMSGAPATTAIVSSLPSSKQGVASAVNDTSRELGSALGIAILGSTLNSGYSSGIDGAVSNLPDDVAERAKESISFVQQGAGRLGADVLAQAEQAFVDATTTSLLVAAGALLATAVVVAVRAPRRERATTSRFQVEVASTERTSRRRGAAGRRRRRDPMSP